MLPSSHPIRQQIIDRRIVQHCGPVLLALILALNTACKGIAPTGPILQPWQYTDVRLIDPVEAIDPAFDLVAAYSRLVGDELQLRLDWLDQPLLPAADVYLAIDSTPGGNTALPGNAQTRLEWDTLLVIPAHGALHALDADFAPRPEIALRVWREIRPDSLEIYLNLSALGSSPQLAFQVFVVAPGSGQVIDETDPFYSDGLPPPALPVLFAFWNSYPAYTPALALRRWDGAHTGPLGGRHGLYNLLRTAQSQQIPLALLDLKASASLQALQYAGYLEYVQSMQAQNLLTLPEYLPTYAPENAPLQDWLSGRLANQAQTNSRVFSLPPVPFSYSPSGPAPALPGTQIQFALAAREANTPAFLHTVQPLRLKEQVVVLIPAGISSVEQATTDGPTLELRRALVATALEQAHSSSILVLGGELPGSAWGDPQSARATFKYLAARPWVQPLNAASLLSLPAVQAPAGMIHALPGSPYQPDLTADEGQTLLQALKDAPPGAITDAAWQAFLSLYNPVYPAADQLPALRANYAGQVWSLLQAARWSAAPAVISNCDSDPDRDGQSECILSSLHLYAQFEPENGALTHLLTPDHQWIGPSSQIITGLSDPFTWQTGQGLAADPAVIPAAFAGPGGPYQVSLQDLSLTFTSEDTHETKTFTLHNDILEVAYHFQDSPSFSTLTIPILISPLACLANTWRNCLAPSGDETTWRINLEDSGAELLIHAIAAPMAMRSFLDSPAYLFTLPEDPNQDFPAGHFLPFPLSVIDLTITRDFSVIIQILNSK